MCITNSFLACGGGQIDPDHGGSAAGMLASSYKGRGNGELIVQQVDGTTGEVHVRILCRESVWDSSPSYWRLYEQLLLSIGGESVFYSFGGEDRLRPDDASGTGRSQPVQELTQMH